jgi:PadR family transcriptional regulator, regulatory protein PadR
MHYLVLIDHRAWAEVGCTKPRQTRPQPRSQIFRARNQFAERTSSVYIYDSHIWGSCLSNSEFKKGSAEMLVLSVLENRARHGYDICKLIERLSGGELSFNVATFYPLLYKLEERGLIEGRWVEKPAQRRRRFYRITTAGRNALVMQRKTFQRFVAAVTQVLGGENA